MKILSAETNLSSATNVGSASVVRIFNSDSSTATVTKKIVMLKKKDLEGEVKERRNGDKTDWLTEMRWKAYLESEEEANKSQASDNIWSDQKDLKKQLRNLKLQAQN